MSVVHDLSLNEMRDAADTAVTIAAAHEAGLFESLADGAATADELASRLGIDPRAVGILLPVLAELDLVEPRDGRYALTPTTRRELGDPSSPEHIGRGLSLWLENLRAWTQLPEVLATGEPIIRRTEEPDRDAIARFMAGMAAAPEERVRRVVRACLDRRPDARTALDLGGGPGNFARGFLAEGLDVTLLDQPATIDYVADAYGLAELDGLHLAGRDFLEDSLPDGPFDIVLLSNILHMYSPEENRALLRKVAGITAPGGVAAIADFVRGRSPRAARFAVIMLLRTSGGGTYTEDEYTAWLREAGFEAAETEDVDTDRQIITAVRDTGGARPTREDR